MRVGLDVDIKCIAYEEMSSCTKSWSQNVAFCIPEKTAKSERNAVLTHLGSDEGSIDPQSAHKQLFDLGVDSAYMQFCIRTDDDSFSELLGDNCGHSIFESGNPVGAAVLENSPARVVISALGRIEIETRIPGTNAETLAGPHTHLLPARLNAKRKMGIEIPSGYVEVLSLYPEHPAFDKYGEARSFQQSIHDRFQKMLAEFGPEGYCLEKSRAKTADCAGSGETENNSATSTMQLNTHRVAKIQTSFLEGL